MPPRVREPSAPPPVADVLPDLSWADEWARNVRDHVFVREDDGVFIQRPNKAFRLNPSAVRMLRRLFDGESIHDVLGPHRDDPRAVRDTERFLRDLRCMLKHGLPDDYASPAVTRRPVDTSFSHLPVLAEVAVTYRCNASCSFCYAGCNLTENPVGTEREMTLDEVRLVLDRIAREAQVPSVSFTGGEATLRDDLPDMIRHARSLDLRVNLITNGLRAEDPELVGRLVDAGLHSAQVSLEGTTAEVHEGITGMYGSYERTLAGLRNLRDAGLHVHTNTTICRSNADDALRFPGFVANVLELPRFSMNMVIPTGSAPLAEGPPVLYSEIAEFLPRLMAESRRHDVELMWYSPTPLCMFNTIAEGLGNKGCAACDGLVSVGADGNVLPCASWDRPVGSLLEHTFEEVWTAPEANALRAKGEAPPHCRDCEHLSACHGACPLYWREVGYAELDAIRGPVT